LFLLDIGGHVMRNLQEHLIESWGYLFDVSEWWYQPCHPQKENLTVQVTSCPMALPERSERY